MSADDKAAPDLPHRPDEGPSTVRLRATRQPSRFDDWALVLVARGLHPLLRWVDGIFELHVEEEEAVPARRELAEADREEAELRRAAARDVLRDEAPVDANAALGGLVVALALMVFYAVTGPRRDDAVWFARGSADAASMLAGEWWRSVTALTLHADTGHVLSNIGIGTVMVAAVMRSTGVGFGALLVLLSGVGGNLLNAGLHRTGHSSVGFSTAVFGAVGLLGALSFVQLRHRARRTRPAWTALVGGAALLALLGASERSDVLAHLFGGLSGVVLGLVAGRLRPRLSPLGQGVGIVLTATLVIGAWRAALG
jgi:membrane associated rhomboid family serine protease